MLQLYKRYIPTSFDASFVQVSTSAVDKRPWDNPNMKFDELSLLGCYFLKVKSRVVWLSKA